MAMPLALPLLFMGGSMAFNTMAANKQANAIASANNAERLRQRKYDDQAFAINDQSRDRYEDFSGQQDERSESLAEYYKGAASSEPTQPISAAPKSDSNLVVSADAKASEEAGATNDANAERRAAVNSFGDLLGGFGRMNMRDAGELNTLRSFKRGSSSVLPYELQAAQTKGQGLRLIGDLLNVASSVTMPMALTAGGASTPAWMQGWKPSPVGTAVPASSYSGPVLTGLY